MSEREKQSLDYLDNKGRHVANNWLMSAPADNLDFWQLPQPELRLQDLRTDLVVIEGDLWLQPSLTPTSLRRFYLTRSMMAYSAVTFIQSTADRRIRRVANVVNAKVAAFEQTKAVYVLRIAPSKATAMELFSDRADELDRWLAALAEVCVFTEIENDYKFLHKLGAGTYAQVYAAIELGTGKHVAVKRIKPSHNETASGEMSSEIRVLRELRHPGIVQLLRVYETWKDTCLVLSLLPGLSLQRYMSAYGPLGEGKTKELLRSLLDILVYLHKCEVVHRDIKPGNVMVDTRSGNLMCKLIDFGLAIKVADIQEVNICGTPGYIAPEILSHKEMGTKADIFSAGMVAYTALRGKNPFIFFDRKTTLSLNQHAQISFSSPRWTQFSPSLLNLLTQMTALNPSERPTASECLRHPCFAERNIGSDCVKSRHSLICTQASGSENSTNGDDRSPAVDISPVP